MMGSHVTLVVSKAESASGDVDEFENRWVFSSDIALPLWSDVSGPLEAFYETHTVVPRMWSAELSGNMTHVLYDISAHLDGSPHGAPFDMRTRTGALSTAASGNGLPGQIALVVDYHADLTGISEFGPHARPRARRRGRHYHGPLANLLDYGTGQVPFWEAALTTEVKNAYAATLAAVGVGLEWDVWSRVDAAVYPVIGGWVDTTPHRARKREEPTNIKVNWP